MIIELDMYQTLAIAVVVLMLGKFLRKKCSLLEKFCIPAPVVGGVLFAVFTCVCYVTGIVEFTFDDILKEVCMVFFFTSVGFQANLKVLKSRRQIHAGVSEPGYCADSGPELFGGGAVQRERTAAGGPFAPVPFRWLAATAQRALLALCWRTLAFPVQPRCAPLRQPMA